MKTAEYLASVKARLQITSDYAMAKALKVSRQRASDYVLGKVIPGPVVAFRIAEIIGDQPAAVVADLEAERAERDGRPEEADYLRDVLRRLGGAAASVLLAVGIGTPPNAGAASGGGGDHSSVYSSCKTKRRKKASPWTGLIPRMAY
jgi:predicted transcriptional regulator